MNRIILNISQPSFLIVTTLYILFYFVNNKIPIPVDFHYYVASLKTSVSDSDKIVSLYHLLRTPIYDMIDWVFLNPAYYFFISMMFSIALIALSHNLFIQLNNTSRLTNILFTLASGPLFFRVLKKMFPNLFTELEFIYPFVWGFDLYFTVRGITAISLLIIIYIFQKNTYSKKHLITIYIFLLVSLLSHPTSGVILYGYIVSIFLYLYHSRKIVLNAFFYLTSIFIIGIIPNFIKIFILKKSIEPVSDFVWFSNIFFDEADDFSSLFRINESPEIVIVFSLLVFLLSWISYIKKSVSMALLLCAILPIFYFSFFCCD